MQIIINCDTVQEAAGYLEELLHDQELMEEIRETPEYGDIYTRFGKIEFS